MPMSVEQKADSFFMPALKTTDSWKTAYIDNVQHLLVNIQTPQGQTLINKILDGQTLFPNDYAKNLTTFYVIAENKKKNRYSDLYPLAKGALNLNPSPASASLLKDLQGPQNSLNDIADYLNDFIKNQDRYKSRNGYLQYLRTAVVCADSLAHRQPQENQKYKTWAQQFAAEAKAIGRRQTW